eukprot:TRINITY_DN2021_c0_g3_i1.p1 TRINITY_DN2021_c0_g3~~TRINITY_DN2021_c0_g3_i1.p1  ORF type:complete len:339 (-),score=75.99 TRINITY_DN2021_c0_g3_i1:26-1042(-)
MVSVSVRVCVVGMFIHVLACRRHVSCFWFICFFFFSSRRRHTRCREVSWARRCVQETGINAEYMGREKDAMNLSMNLATQKRKQEALHNPRFGQNSYPYECLGRDHQKVAEGQKEAERERKREIISKQLSDISMKQKLLTKERQGQCKASLDFPSFSAKPSNKLQYKKFLLQQMELDKDRRKLEKEFDRLQISEAPVVEKSSRRSKPTPAQIPLEKPSEKRFRMEKAEKALDKVYMDKSIKNYHTQVKETAEKRKESAVKLAEVLERQIKDRNDKKQRDRSLLRDWKTSSASHAARPVERKRKINETSENNAMIDLVSPNTHSPSPSKRCCKCNKSFV